VTDFSKMRVHSRVPHILLSGKTASSTISSETPHSQDKGVGGLRFFPQLFHA